MPICPVENRFDLELASPNTWVVAGGGASGVNERREGGGREEMRERREAGGEGERRREG